LTDLKNDCKDLNDMHKQYTEDGAPKWYFPKRMTDIMDKIESIVKEISDNGLIKRSRKKK